MIWSNFRWGLSEVGRSVLSTTSDGMATLSWQRLWCDELDSLSYPAVKSEIGNFPRCFNWCSFQSSKPTFGPSRWHVRPANQDTTRQTKLPCCCSNYLEQSSSSFALVIYQSRTIQSWVENPSLQSRFILRVNLLTFLLTPSDLVSRNKSPMLLHSSITWCGY